MLADLGTALEEKDKTLDMISLDMMALHKQHQEDMAAMHSKFRAMHFHCVNLSREVQGKDLIGADNGKDMKLTRKFDFLRRRFEPEVGQNAVVNVLVDRVVEDQGVTPMNAIKHEQKNTLTPRVKKTGKRRKKLVPDGLIQTRIDFFLALGKGTLTEGGRTRKSARKENFRV